MRFICLALCLASLPAFMGACAAPAEAIKTDAHDPELLSDSVRLHWEGVRWGDPEKAAKFIENGATRTAYKHWLHTQAKSHKFVDVKVMAMDLGPELDPPMDGRSRTADVRVLVEGYTFPQQVLEELNITQRWYRNTHGWWLEWEAP
jgi:hypothetical protein